MGEKVRLVVVDTLSAARSGSGRAENDNDDMTDAAAALRRLAEATGAHVMALHHTPKKDKTTMRGGGGSRGTSTRRFRC
jgi:RecA-family ATPase